jgi:Leucine-rich repeat (LRR) protein
MSDLKKLVQLDLCNNQLSSGFDELAKLKTLRVLDLANNKLDMPIQNFNAQLLEPLKRMPKLEYVTSAFCHPFNTSSLSVTRA